jgi:hypothetical protein
MSQSTMMNFDALSNTQAVLPETIARYSREVTLSTNPLLNKRLLTAPEHQEFRDALIAEIEQQNKMFSRHLDGFLQASRAGDKQVQAEIIDSLRDERMLLTSSNTARSAAFQIMRVHAEMYAPELIPNIDLAYAKTAVPLDNAAVPADKSEPKIMDWFGQVQSDWGARRAAKKAASAKAAPNDVANDNKIGGPGWGEGLKGFFGSTLGLSVAVGAATAAAFYTIGAVDPGTREFSTPNLVSAGLAAGGLVAIIKSIPSGPRFKKLMYSSLAVGMGIGAYALIPNDYGKPSTITANGPWVAVIPKDGNFDNGHKFANPNLTGDLGPLKYAEGFCAVVPLNPSAPVQLWDGQHYSYVKKNYTGFLRVKPGERNYNICSGMPGVNAVVPNVAVPHPEHPEAQLSPIQPLQRNAPMPQALRR